VSRLLLLALASSATGCAFINQQVELAPLPSYTERTAAPRRVVLRDLVDARSDPTRVGVVKNGWGMDTASVVTTTDLVAAVSSALVDSLIASGWAVTRAASTVAVPVPRGEDWVVSGWLRSVMSEPIIGMWTIDLRAEAEVVLEVRTATRLFRRTVRGYHVEPDNMICLAPCMETGLRQALANAVHDAVRALLELSERVPPAVLDPAPTLLYLQLEVPP
jgi:hypothetical protein